MVVLRSWIIWSSHLGWSGRKQARCRQVEKGVLADIDLAGLDTAEHLGPFRRPPSEFQHPHLMRFAHAGVYDREVADL